MAANSIASTLAPMPQGIAAVAPDEEALEIIIDNEDGTFTGAPPEPKAQFDDNLAETMLESGLTSLSSELLDLFEQDINSRKDWVEMYVKGLEVLGTKYEERTEPWEGACGVFSTVLTEAAIRFQADTITETFPAAGPVKTEIIGAIDKLKEEAAKRVSDDMNYQLTEVMKEYRPEHERLLYSLGLCGAAFKKVYYDPGKKRQTAMFIPAEDMIIPYGASSLDESERVTHVMRKTKVELDRLMVKGFYRDLDLGEPTKETNDVEDKKREEQGYSVVDDDRYQVLEMHVFYELPGGDPMDPAGEDEAKRLALPYVVTIDKGTTKVLAVRRNWDPEDDSQAKRQHFVQYTYVPGFGAYGMGLIHIIGGYARAGTSIIRQLVDAGTLSNLPGGMKTRGLRIKGDDTPIEPGEWRDVDVGSGALRDNIMPLPYKEPSTVLLSLLQQITEEGRRLGSIADMKVSDMSAQAPVGTTLALLERQLKTMSAVQARVHYSMKAEFRLLHGIIRDYTPDEYNYEPSDSDRKAKKGDYDLVTVIPVSDPNSATLAQRIMQYQAVSQLASQAPQVYDLPFLHRQMIEVLGVPNAEKLVPTQDDQKPRDPVSENMSFLTMKPSKAFIAQNHDAHIAVHNALLQDPTIQQQVGQNPMAQQIMSAIQAHIAEHMAFKYRAGVEAQLGVPLPAPDADLNPLVEAQLSTLVAQAAGQYLSLNQKQAAQAAAAQQAQDPVIQMQQQELMIKKQDADTKKMKAEGDLTLKAQELQMKQGEKPAVETPEMVAQRHGQEMQMQQDQQAQMQQRHMLELQQAQQSHMAEAQRTAQGHAQEVIYNAQKHAQNQTHAREAHLAKLEQQKTEAKARAALAAKNKPKKAE